MTSMKAAGFLTSMQKNPYETIKERMRQNPDVNEGALSRMEQWLPNMMAAEDKYGVKRGILSSIGWKESRFKPSVITGPANKWGAQGLMQIVGSQHPNVDPTDPNASIDYAGSFFKKLLGQFGGNYEDAAGAYNAGARALREMKAGTRAWSGEAQDYMATVPSMTRPSTKEIANYMMKGDEDNIRLNGKKTVATGFLTNITSMKMPSLSEMFGDKSE